MIKLQELLNRLKREGFENVKTEEEIENSNKYFGEGNRVVLADDDNFRIFYKDGKYILETSFSNQPITKEWLRRASTLFILGFVYEQD